MHNQHSTLTLFTVLILSLSAGQVMAQDTAGKPVDAATPAPAAATESTAGEHVTRALFTSEVQNREPTDTVTSLSNDKNKIYFYSELSGLGGQTVTHRWEYQGKTMGEVKFNVGGPRWRVWSSKTLLPQWTGEWRVLIIDGAGNQVGEASFNYTEAKTPQN